MAEVLELKAARGARGTVRLPGSKSISNRVLLLAALAAGETEVSGLLDADDTRVMREALSRLGITLVDEVDGLKIRGGAGTFAEKKASLFLGNAGTALRPLTAAAARIEVQGELVSKPYVEITLNVMRRFGVEVARSGWTRFTLHKGSYSSPGQIFVEGDASSASYFLAAGALGGGPVRVEGVGRD